MPKKLDDGEKNFLRLIAMGQSQHFGWARSSPATYPYVQTMPPELVEHKPDEAQPGWGLARLTPRGEAVLDAMMNWLRRRTP